MSEAEKMRAAFESWVQDQGCDTDGAWSAWQGAWNLRALRQQAAPQEAVPRKIRHYRDALEAIARQPAETMSDGKAVSAMVRIAKAALKATPPAQPATPAPSKHYGRILTELAAMLRIQPHKDTLLIDSDDLKPHIQYIRDAADALNQERIAAILAASASQPTPGKSVSDTVGVLGTVKASDEMANTFIRAALGPRYICSWCEQPATPGRSCECGSDAELHPVTDGVRGTVKASDGSQQG